MFLQSLNGRAPGRVGYTLIFLMAAASISGVCSAASSRSTEVASTYKAEHVAEFQLAAYQSELLECSALAAIHMWIGDNLGDDSGAAIRKKLNDDYWINVSKGYLSLAEDAAGDVDLSQEVGVRMRALSTEFRDLTESQAEPDRWAAWYDRIDRCDTWRPDRPTHAFYNNGRKPVIEPEPAAKAISTSG